MNTEAVVSNFYSGDQGEKYFAYQNAAAADMAKVSCRKFAPFIKAGDRVLDFGCGGGWILSELRAAVKMGVEVNAAARKVCEANGIRVLESAASLAAGERFDKIITHHCLEHVPCPIQALAELRAVLKPGGLLIAVVPMDDWRMQRDFSGHDKDHHLHTWTPRLLANTLVEAGLEPVSHRIIAHTWPRHWELLNRWLPSCLANAACAACSVIRRRRELLAVAKAPMA